MLSSILMATICRVWTVFSISSLYSHLTVIVGQRLCATLGSHHHHHRHYISSDVSSEQRRPWVHYNMSAITKKYREWCHHYTIFEKTSASRGSSTPNQITSLPSTGHISRSYRCPRPGLAWPPNVSHWNAYDRCSTSDGSRMSPTRILWRSLTSVFLSSLGVQ